MMVQVGSELKRPLEEENIEDTYLKMYAGLAALERKTVARMMLLCDRPELDKIGKTGNTTSGELLLTK